MASPKGRRRRRAARTAKIAAEAAQANVAKVATKKVVEPVPPVVAPPEPVKKEASVKTSVAGTVSSKARKLKEKLTSKS